MGKLVKTQQLEISLKKIINGSYEDINKKDIRNTKVVCLHEESLPNLCLCMLINVIFVKKHVHQTVLWLWLGFMLPLSTVHMN